VLTRVDEQVRQRAARGLDLVLLEAAGLDEAPGSGIGDKDLAGLAERWT